MSIHSNRLATHHQVSKPLTSPPPTRSLFSAGTAAPPTLSPRYDTRPTVIWCTPGSRTYVQIQMLRPVAGPVVSTMIRTAYSIVMAHIYVGNGEDDGVISNDGNFNWAEAQGMVLHTWNTNNHQTTYGVLAAAIQALWGYMDGQEFGTARFTIFDGGNEVGAGMLG